MTQPSDDALAPGTVLADRYRVQSLLGQGAMGAVYLVEHVHMRKRLALKVLLREVSDSEEVAARFEREAMAAAHIDHPNIVAATDFGRTADGSLFLVLEYVDGVSLREVIARGALEIPRAISIAMQIASALARAHSLGIVHRDLKPENIMVLKRDGSEELVKVLDFGIAKVNAHIADGAPAPGSTGPILTRVGAVFGTPEYMAPEQAMGEVVDARADLYALGITLYEMLTGSRPFEASNAVALLTMHLTAAPPPMSIRAPNVNIPPALEALAMSLLAKQPNDRPANAAEVLAALERIRSEVFAPASSRPDLASLSGPTSFKPNGTAVNGTGPQAAIVGTAPTALAPFARTKLAGPLAKARTLVEPLLSRVPPSSRPAAIAAAAGVFFILIVALVTLAIRPSAKERRADNAANETADAGTSTSTSWLSFKKELSADRLKGAIALGVPELEKLQREFPEDTRVPREIVRSYVLQKRFAEAMNVLAKLAAVDAKAAADPDMLIAIDVALESDTGFEPALALLESGSLGSRGIDILVEKSGQTGANKTRFQKSIAKPEVRALASPGTTTILELREAKTCTDKKAAVERAEANGDVRALSLLIPLRKRGGCGFFGRGDCYGCLRKDDTLENAIGAIERRAR